MSLPKNFDYIFPWSNVHMTTRWTGIKSAKRKMSEDKRHIESSRQALEKFLQQNQILNQDIEPLITAVEAMPLDEEVRIAATTLITKRFSYLNSDRLYKQRIVNDYKQRVQSYEKYLEDNEPMFVDFLATNEGYTNLDTERWTIKKALPSLKSIKYSRRSLNILNIQFNESDTHPKATINIFFDFAYEYEVRIRKIKCASNNMQYNLDIETVPANHPDFIRHMVKIAYYKVFLNKDFQYDDLQTNSEQQHS